MSVNSALGKLRRAEKDMRLQWIEVKGHWSDQNSRRFEQRYIAQLLARLRTTELAMGHIATVLQKVHHDCE